MSDLPLGGLEVQRRGTDPPGRCARGGVVKHEIHVHHQNMRAGKPAVIDRTYKRSTHHTRLEILCPCGCDEVAAVMIQSKEQNACGAHIWIEATRTRGDGPESE